MISAQEKGQRESRMVGKTLGYHQLRGYEIAEIYYFIKRCGRVEWGTLKKRFAVYDNAKRALNVSLTADSLNFLEFIGAVKKKVGKDYIYEIPDSEKSNDAQFQFIMLKKLSEARHIDSAILDITNYLYTKGKLLVKKRGILPELEANLDMEQGWTAEKLDCWLHFAAYMGLVRPIKHKEYDFFVAPSTDLLFVLLSECASINGSPFTIWKFLDYARDRYIDFLTESGDLHPGFCQSILHLEQKKKVTLPPPLADAKRLALTRIRGINEIYVELGGEN